MEKAEINRLIYYIMKKTDSYNDLSAAIMKNFRRGMITNHLANRDRLARDIENGMLFNHESENGLVLLTDRGSHYLMHFYLHSPALIMEIPTADKPIVTEIVKRKDDASFDSTERMLTDCGFTQIFRRRRLVSSTSEFESNDATCDFGSIDDFQTVRSLLACSFSPLTGCIPDDDELKDALMNSQIIVIRENNAITALLHFRNDKKNREIRHLCVLEGHRARGLASSLVGKFLNLNRNEKKTIVWVREGYREAETVYEKFGFVPDGMISDVFVKNI